jgi:hypothetical protein
MPAIKVPRDLEKTKTPRQGNKPGRKPTLTKEERKQRKNENNRLYRLKHNAEARQRSKNWRANQTPEQRELQLQRVRDWKAARKLAANKAGSVSDAGLPLANPAVS